MTFVTIGLILLVAALNILITLVMMVMEKYRDIAVLMSMGARRNQIRSIFMLQGVLIGVVGSAIGLVVGYTLCYFANHYRWIPLDEQVYALSYVPFEPRAGMASGSPPWPSWSASWRPSIRRATPPASRRPKCCGTNEPWRYAAPANGFAGRNW